MTPLPLSFATDTVTVRFPTITRDARNNPVADFDNPRASYVVAGCLLEPGASQEVLGGRDVTSTVWTLYLPPDALIDATCQVEVGGRRYAVDGDPMTWSKLSVANKVAVLKAWG